jgi:hypothetical protein
MNGDRPGLLRYGEAMKRAVLLGIALLATACGNKAFQSLCANQVPPPAACNTLCDPSPGAQNACPAGYHCSADGNECGNGYSCTSDGFCQTNGGGSGPPPPDADCPAVHFAATKTTPTVELLLDQSGSMTAAYGNTTRWNALRAALVDPTNGVVKKLDGQVVFGATLYSARSNNNVNVPPCPALTTKPRALNNYAAIRDLLNASNPIQDTPTAASIDAVRLDFAAHPPAMGSPPIIVLATDGLPDTCANPNPANQTEQDAANAVTVTATQAAYTAGIKLFFLFVGDAGQAGTHPQRMANAGAGKDPVTGTEKFYVATNPDEMTAAFAAIVGGVVSCDLKLSSHLDAAAGPSGTVMLNGATLAYGTDWTLDADGVTIHLVGAACTTLKTVANPVVDASFPCGTVFF